MIKRNLNIKPTIYTYILIIVFSLANIASVWIAWFNITEIPAIVFSFIEFVLFLCAGFFSFFAKIQNIVVEI